VLLSLLLLLLLLLPPLLLGQQAWGCKEAAQAQLLASRGTPACPCCLGP
jgi:hypothetical protein